MEGDYRFGDYSFTPETGELISANSRVVLTKKDSEVLECLLRNTNDLVTKEIINKTVWANTVVSETVLRVCIKRLRKTLGDDCRSPSYIETIKGRGYRLLPPVQRLSLTSRQAPQLSNNAKHTDEAKKKPPEPFSSVSFVGRKYALEVLNKNLTEVLNGEARTVFVCGKAGMGKTELIKRFADSVTKNERVRILMGQGLKLAESREAYCPISSALYSFCKEIGDESFRELLYAYAPMWLQQFSWLTSTAERK